MEKMANKDDRKWEELRLTFSILIDDIRELKSQQWKVANYVLLLDGALIGIAKILSENCSFGLLSGILIISFALLLLILGFVIIHSFQNSIIFRRDKIDYIYNRSNNGNEYIHFTEEVCNLIGKREPFKMNTNISKILYVVQFAGFIFVVLLTKHYLTL